MDACKAKMEKSLANTPLKFNEASSSAADASCAVSHGDVQGKLMGRKSEASTLAKRKRQNRIPKQAPVEGGSSSFDEARVVNTKPQRFITFELPDDLPTDEEIRQQASTLHKRKRQNPTPCPKQAPAEGGSSSFDEARVVNTKPQRFITFELPDDLPTDEEIRQQAPDECIALCLLMKRDAELISRLNLQRMNAVKTELQKNGQQNSAVLAAVDDMISKLEEFLAAARALPSFNNGTKNSGDQEIPGEGPPMNEVKTVARYDTRKLKMGKQVTETSVVVARKNTSSRE